MVNTRLPEQPFAFLNSSMVSYLILIRPVNVAITFVSVLIVLFLSENRTGFSAWLPSLFAALSASLICAGANVINDLFDVEIDRINRPNRPLVTGAMSVESARRYWLGLSVLGVATSVLVNWTCLLIAAGAVVVLYFYSAYLKSSPLWGNLMVSGFTGMAFIYGGVAIDRLNDAWWPAVFSVLFHLGREILKDIEDMEGDGRRGARTFPIKYGRRNALVLTTSVFVLVAAATTTAFVAGYYGWVFFGIILAGIYPVLAFVTLSMWKNPSPPNLHRLNTLLKLDMLIGVVAILAG